MPDAQQQPTDFEGFAVLRSDKRTRYSTIDQHADGNARPRARPGVGPFHNKNLPDAELTELAKKIIEQKGKSNE